MTNPTELIAQLRRYSCEEHGKTWDAENCIACEGGKDCNDAADALEALQARLDSESASVNRLDDALEALQAEKHRLILFIESEGGLEMLGRAGLIVNAQECSDD